MERPVHVMSKMMGSHSMLNFLVHYRFWTDYRIRPRHHQTTMLHHVQFGPNSRAGVAMRVGRANQTTGVVGQCSISRITKSLHMHMVSEFALILYKGR